MSLISVKSSREFAYLTILDCIFTRLKGITSTNPKNTVLQGDFKLISAETTSPYHSYNQ